MLYHISNTITKFKSIINKIKPDEIYNLAAQSHVRVSFDIPEYTADITALGALRILESIRILNLKKTKLLIHKPFPWLHARKCKGGML